MGSLGKFRFSVWCRSLPHETFCAIWGTSCSLCILSVALRRQKLLCCCRFEDWQEQTSNNKFSNGHYLQV